MEIKKEKGEKFENNVENIVCTPFHGQKKFLVFWVFGFF